MVAPAQAAAARREEQEAAMAEVQEAMADQAEIAVARKVAAARHAAEEAKMAAGTLVPPHRPSVKFRFIGPYGFLMNRENKRKIKELMLSRAQEGGDFVEVEPVARFTKDEMEAAINGLSSGVRQDDRLVYHFTSKETAGFILEGQGLRASKVGQLGGGLSVCKAPPHEMGWEQYGGPTWREGVGRRLWGEKWENVLIGHEDADKLEVVIVAKIPALLFDDVTCARSLLFRTCILFLVELDPQKSISSLAALKCSIRSPEHRMPDSTLINATLSPARRTLPPSQPKHTP